MRATEEKQIRFNQLHSLCHSRIRYVKVCPTCGREVNEDEIVRGYEYEKGRYAILSKDELEKFQSRSTGTVDIVRFVALEEIDSRLLQQDILLRAVRNGGKAYLLLKEALSAAGRIGGGQNHDSFQDFVGRNPHLRRSTRPGDHFLPR